MIFTSTKTEYFLLNLTLNLQQICTYKRVTGSRMAELLLDPNIRLYVFIPIVLICLFVGLIRHYVTILLESDKKTELSQVGGVLYFGGVFCHIVLSPNFATSPLKLLLVSSYSSHLLFV